MKCPCGSGKEFTSCCDTFFRGAKHAPTPEKLMRSRFCAYYLGGHGDYLMDTWWPPMAQNLNRQELDQRNREWLRLDILGKSQHGNDGMVEFKAWYRDADGEEKALYERSVFKRLNKRWLYVGGEVPA